MYEVTAADGILQGPLVQNDYGGSFYSFKGIPYAKPPQRFQAPESPEPWEGVLNATEFGSACYQYNPMQNITNMSEDCLYLNVYTPDIEPSGLLPVMFFIHGGGFIWGSGNDDLYGPEFLVRLGVILVTINYRLEALGYLCLHNADVPGNAGMKDQVAALRWVKKNIKKFGGDPENITIFGESAGAASVAYHLISPMTKGLFKRAIMQSGTATNWWSQDFATNEKPILLAKRLGYSTNNTNELYSFFKNQSLDSLTNLTLREWKAQKSYEFYFGIVSEKDFGQEIYYSGDVIESFRHGVHNGVEVILGYNTDEGLISLVVGQSLDKMVAEAQYYDEFYAPRDFKINSIIADQMEVALKMREYYGDVSDDRLIRFQGVDMFIRNIMLTAKLLSLKTTTYVYRLTAYSERNFMASILGLSDVVAGKEVVCHTDDLAYLFPVKVAGQNVTQNSTAFELITRMTTLWTNFAKYGNPTPNNSLGVIWEPYSLENQEFLNIGNNLTTDSAPDKEELEFWDSFYNKYWTKYTV